MVSDKKEALTSCVHQGKTIYHAEAVCPICVDLIRRTKKIPDLRIAILDLHVWAGWAGSNTDTKNRQCESALKRVENLVSGILGD